MTVYTPASKNTTTYSGNNKLGGNILVAGMPMGLLLALTYSTTVATVFTGQSKNTTSYTAQVKN